MSDLFAYGTLMCADIFQSVTGVLLPQADGRLTGFRRWSVRSEHYPAIVPDQTAHVEGVLYRHLSDPVWERLDRFEGEMYARRRVRVALDDGCLVFADTYVWRTAYAARLDRPDWDFSEFLIRHRDRFVRQLT